MKTKRMDPRNDKTFLTRWLFQRKSDENFEKLPMHACAGKQINLAEVKFAVASSLYSCHSIDDQLTSWYESSRAKRE